MKPIPTKPSIIIAQVAGSGTAEIEIASTAALKSPAVCGIVPENDNRPEVAVAWKMLLTRVKLVDPGVDVRRLGTLALSKNTMIGSTG
jgi:hypothetical protein